MPSEFNSSATVLYVDDEELARKYFALTFSQEYEVLTAPDADSAVAILKEAGSRIGVVVTDFHMPGRKGSELLAQIEREYPHIIRILVTAFAEKDVLLKSINAGEIFRVIEKPYEMSYIRTVLAQAVERARDRAIKHQRLAAIDDTLAFLAHELNTPLAVMLNFSLGIQRRVAETPLDPAQQLEIARASRIMHDNARYSMSVLSMFFDSVRTAKPKSLYREISTAGRLINSLLDTYPLSADQRASITLDVTQDFSVSARPNCISLVLSSLLSNSLRALQGCPEPAIRFSVIVENNNRPQIRIADNGPGIPEEIQARLLLDPVTTYADKGGSGSGMLFCKRMLQSIGGNLEIHSEVGQGTIAILHFPRFETAPDE